MISPDAFDQARFNLEREEALKALQAHDFAEATIRAPIDGFVTARKIKLGNTLQPNTIAFEIKRADTLEAILNIPEKELIKINAGQSASIRVDALEDAEFDGTLCGSHRNRPNDGHFQSNRRGKKRARFVKTWHVCKGRGAIRLAA